MVYVWNEQFPPGWERRWYGASLVAHRVVLKLAVVELWC